MARNISMGIDGFAIDLHHARTRHFDLRLTHDGSVSLWAVAPAIPATGQQAQVAIRIEELPAIAREGFPSSSERTEWDDGPMTVRRWREGEEALVTLHGSRTGGLGGDCTLSLVHVGSVGADDDHWTITALDAATLSEESHAS